MSDEPLPLDTHGTLGKLVYVIQSKQSPGVTLERLAAVLPDHLQYQFDIERDGILFAAGPMQTQTGEVRGLIIVNAVSFDEAKKIADSDPFHAQGLRNYTLERWSLNEGGFLIKVSYSNQSFSFR